MSRSYDKEEILIIIEGGLVQDVILPEDSNTRIIIRDYDIECVDEESILSLDEDGEKCIESVWKN